MRDAASLESSGDFAESLEMATRCVNTSFRGPSCCYLALSSCCFGGMLFPLKVYSYGLGWPKCRCGPRIRIGDGSRVTVFSEFVFVCRGWLAGRNLRLCFLLLMVFAAL